MKIDKKQVSALAICIVIVLFSVYMLYEQFAFHTYEQRVYYDYQLTVEADNCVITNMEIYNSEDLFAYGGGMLTIKEKELFDNEEEVEIQIRIIDDKGDEQILSNTFTYNTDIAQYPLSYQYQTKSKNTQIENIELSLVAGDQTIVLPVEFQQLVAMAGSTKEYRMENVYVGEQLLRLGNLVTTKNINQYDTISIEYGYESEDVGDDGYRVFHKISLPIKEYFNMSDQGVYIEEDEILLNEQNLRVVVILSNEDEEYIFAIDLSLVKAGDSHEQK